MARAVVAPIRASMAGASVTLTAPTVDGDAVRPYTALYIQNTSGVAVTVTIVTGATVGARAVADDTVVIPANSTRLLGPFSEEAFPQPSGATKDLIHVDYDTPASILRASIGLNY